MKLDTYWAFPDMACSVGCFYVDQTKAQNRILKGLKYKFVNKNKQRLGSRNAYDFSILHLIMANLAHSFTIYIPILQSHKTVLGMFVPITLQYYYIQ